MRKLIACQRGATTIEYGVFAALAIALVTSGVSTLGENIGSTFTRAGAAMAAAPEPAGTAAARQGGMSAGGTTLIHVEDIHVKLGESRDEFLEDQE